MRRLTLHQHQLRDSVWTDVAGEQAGISTGFAAIDTILPGKSLESLATHELLYSAEARSPDSSPARESTCWLAAAILLRSTLLARPGHHLIWYDPAGRLHPPAIAQLGLPANRLLVFRAKDPAQALWGIEQCLRCKAVAAVVGDIGAMNYVQARRLKLAAETGGGIGLWIRREQVARFHAASTRWRVESCPGARDVQRTRLTLIHGHGGHIGKSILLEVCRGTYSVRAIEELVDRSSAEKSAIAIG